jgi:hypothetical protein
MAVAAVEEQVKLKDLWKPEFTVANLKSMKTVSFETPSGNHNYNVVGVNRRTAGTGDDETTTTTIFCSSGHELKITQASALLLYPEALSGPSEPVVGRRLTYNKQLGRYMEPVFMLHKNGRRLQDGNPERRLQELEPFTAMEKDAVWEPEPNLTETPPEEPVGCEAGSEECVDGEFTYCSFPGWPCPVAMCDYDSELECWSNPPEECWTMMYDSYGNLDSYGPVDSYGNPLNCESEMSCHPKSSGCPVTCLDDEVVCTETYMDGSFENTYNYCMPSYWGCPEPYPMTYCDEWMEVTCFDEGTGLEYCAPQHLGCDPPSEKSCISPVSGYGWDGSFLDYFDAGWGTCDTYDQYTGWNFFYCEWDMMYVEPNNWYEGILAKDACAECMVCQTPKGEPMPYDDGYGSYSGYSGYSGYSSATVTDVPTSAPTSMPSVSPTVSPTMAPTPTPTDVVVVTPAPTFSASHIAVCEAHCGCTP